MPSSYDLLPDRGHQQQRHEQRDRRDHLARRQLLRAERLPQQPEHDDDPHEAGGHQQDRRRQADHRQQQHHLQRRGQAFRAGPVLRPADVRQATAVRSTARSTWFARTPALRSTPRRIAAAIEQSADARSRLRTCGTSAISGEHVGRRGDAAHRLVALRCRGIRSGRSRRRVGERPGRIRRSSCLWCACWQRPTRRSISAGSVISVSGSAPAVRHRNQHQLVADADQLGKLPGRERHAAEHADDLLGQHASSTSCRRGAPARHTSRNSPSTTASAVPVV